ncbi:HAD family hydrolase [Albibacterium bauzanense]|uniref:Haloacid dehalogenase-like hydrolase n=1 Tax=Albibacterium bauzanense TaxID=653929 RepID=A0A4V2PYB0_9SPHI|nr:HAD family hydrolase [Albibacterium bauzanense]TCK84851.1 haloacid dehalogenase-like hydrolase [Albibacterium bauzanense]
MLSYSDIDTNKNVFIFELDDVLYPQQDYILQVYYLFANFLEYTESFPPAAELTEFLKKSYLQHGSEGVFKKASAVFGIDTKYEENFNRLHSSAQLPLKLLLYPSVLELLKSLFSDQKSVYIFTKGNPLIQLNKLKHLDWQGLDRKLKVYFYDELKLLPDIDPLDYIINENGLKASEVVLIGRVESDRREGEQRGISYLNVSNFLE